MNILANATDQTSTGQIRGRHYIAFQISNTGVMKLGRQKHGKQLFMQSFFCPCRGTWVKLLPHSPEQLHDRGIK
jgi:hypothetical protein